MPALAPSPSFAPYNYQKKKIANNQPNGTIYFAFILHCRMAYRQTESKNKISCVPFGFWWFCIQNTRLVLNIRHRCQRLLLLSDANKQISHDTNNNNNNRMTKELLNYGEGEKIKYSQHQMEIKNTDWRQANKQCGGITRKPTVYSYSMGCFSIWIDFHR